MQASTVYRTLSNGACRSQLLDSLPGPARQPANLIDQRNTHWVTGHPSKSKTSMLLYFWRSWKRQLYQIVIGQWDRHGKN